MRQRELELTTVDGNPVRGVGQRVARREGAHEGVNDQGAMRGDPLAGVQVQAAVAVRPATLPLLTGSDPRRGRPRWLRGRGRAHALTISAPTGRAHAHKPANSGARGTARRRLGTSSDRRGTDNAPNAAVARPGASATAPAITWLVDVSHPRSPTRTAGISTTSESSAIAVPRSGARGSAPATLRVAPACDDSLHLQAWRQLTTRASSSSNSAPATVRPSVSAFDTRPGRRRARRPAGMRHGTWC